MDIDAKLTTVDNDPEVIAIARQVLVDPRVEFQIQDGMTFLTSRSGEQFDLIFADAWPGKFDGLGKSISLLRTGGLYIIDDMLPQANWPENHHVRVEQLFSERIPCAGTCGPLLRRHYPGTDIYFSTRLRGDAAATFLRGQYGL